ncbi:hypothetical protein EDB89DRAFT_808151 [Lactarius sanguifluus]|nr:hypothetical protein EDB89DRAFT_808151 [Lactarius sanguifluus]
MSQTCLAAGYDAYASNYYPLYHAIASPHHILTGAKPQLILMYVSFSCFFLVLVFASLPSPPYYIITLAFLSLIVTRPHSQLPLCFPLCYLLFCHIVAAFRSRSHSPCILSSFITPTHPFPQVLTFSVYINYLFPTE